MLHSCTILEEIVISGRSWSRRSAFLWPRQRSILWVPQKKGLRNTCSYRPVNKGMCHIRGRHCFRYPHLVLHTWREVASSWHNPASFGDVRRSRQGWLILAYLPKNSFNLTLCEIYQYHVTLVQVNYTRVFLLNTLVMWNLSSLIVQHGWNILLDSMTLSRAH